MKHTEKTKTWSESLTVPIFKCCLIIGVGDTVCLQKKFFPKQSPEEAFAICVRDGHGGFGIFLRRDALAHNVIAHECSHAALRIALYLGWNHCHETSEPFALLTEWIHLQVYMFLKKHKEKILDFA